MEARVPARLTAAELRRFGLLVGAAFLALAAIWTWRDHRILAIVGVTIAVPLILLGAVAPTVLGPVYHLWMGLALKLSKITTPIFMGVVYYVVLTPLALGMRLAGRNPMVHGTSKDESFWKPRAPDSRRSNLENKF